MPNNICMPCICNLIVFYKSSVLNNNCITYCSSERWRKLTWVNRLSPVQKEEGCELGAGVPFGALGKQSSIKVFIPVVLILIDHFPQHTKNIFQIPVHNSFSYI